MWATLCAQVWRPAAKVSVLDSGYMLGDGVWEGLRLHRGVLMKVRMRAWLRPAETEAFTVWGKGTVPASRGGEASADLASADGANGATAAAPAGDPATSHRRGLLLHAVCADPQVTEQDFDRLFVGLVLGVVTACLCLTLAPRCRV